MERRRFAGRGRRRPTDDLLRPERGRPDHDLQEYDNYLVMIQIGRAVVVVGSFGWQNGSGSLDRIRTLGRSAAQRAAILR